MYCCTADMATGKATETGEGEGCLLEKSSVIVREGVGIGLCSLVYPVTSGSVMRGGTGGAGDLNTPSVSMTDSTIPSTHAEQAPGSSTFDHKNRCFRGETSNPEPGSAAAADEPDGSPATSNPVPTSDSLTTTDPNPSVGVFYNVEDKYAYVPHLTYTYIVKYVYEQSLLRSVQVCRQQHIDVECNYVERDYVDDKCVERRYVQNRITT